MKKYLYICISCLVFLYCNNGLHQAQDAVKFPEPFLENIKLSEGSLSPAFSQKITEYTATLYETVASLSVLASVEDYILEKINKGDCLIAINGKALDVDIFSDPIEIDFWNQETNVINLDITLHGKFKQYSIIVNLVPVYGETFRDMPEMIDDGTGDQKDVRFDGKYRDDLPNHPGCNKRTSYNANTGFYTSLYNFIYYPNTATVAPGTEAVLPGYLCAAKEYSVVEDITKPIVILVHGNLDSINAWEEFFVADFAGVNISREDIPIFIDTSQHEMLATKLVQRGYRTYAVDFRTELVSTLNGFNSANIDGKSYINPLMLFDAGWTVPIVQHLIKSVMINYPSRKICIIAHSSGVVFARDAIRRLFVEYVDGKNGAINPLPLLKDVILLNGVNHGYTEDPVTCTADYSMATKSSCQIGSIKAEPTDFMKRLNGSRDKWSTPCGDGLTAFGLEGFCMGNRINYTATMINENSEKDVIYDEATVMESARLNSPFCDNMVFSTDVYDSSGYYNRGTAAFHYGVSRSETGMQYILEKLNQ